MSLGNLHTLINSLLARGHIDRRIALEEVHRLQRHPDDLARHDREILHSHDVLQPELDPNYDILIDDVILTVGPGTHAGAAAGLVRVFAAGVELVVAVAGDIDVVVGEFGALVVE